MKLAVLDPGHFHAALVQKTMLPGVDETVHVYAPGGPELDDYLRQVASYNAREMDPTRWRVVTHAGPDYLERFEADKADVVVISGNNRRKTEYLTRAVAAGVHTLADKPMAVDRAGFEALVRAFDLARAKRVLLYDIMTERYEITTILQKELAAVPAVFGELERGTAADPAVTKESVHHFSKLVSGVPLKRPAWYFDTAQQGEGIVDVTTHLVDLVQWECFPGEALDGARDLSIVAAKRWPTVITPAQFTHVTQVPAFPEFLRKDVRADGNLHVYANGEIDYVLKGVHVKVSVRWDYEAPAGAGDTHYSVMRGTRANLVIRQGPAEGYRPTLYIEPVPGVDAAAFAQALDKSLPPVHAKHPGVAVQRHEPGWVVTVPEVYHVGHEAHFGQVTRQFRRYIAEGALPAWEVPNMVAKYDTTTQALALARR
jgi:predicted dehydrogenase